MKKSVWIILFVLLAFAALPALAVTDGELLSVEIVESAMPDAIACRGHFERSRWKCGGADRGGADIL